VIRREPFDWPSFLKSLPFQPVPVWFFLSAVATPLSTAAPALMKASCAEPWRTALAQVFRTMWTVFVPLLGTLATYFWFGRRRLMDPRHRRLGDGTMALIVIVGLAEAVAITRHIVLHWPTLGPSLAALRSACWK
jgi:hypothetical protein